MAAAIRDAQLAYHQLPESGELQGEIAKLTAQAKASPDDAAVFMAAVAPQLPPIRESATRGDANLIGVLALTVVRRLELSHGHLPESLDEATAEAGLDSIPVDPFSGAPMQYAVIDGVSLQIARRYPNDDDAVRNTIFHQCQFAGERGRGQRHKQERPKDTYSHSAFSHDVISQVAGVYSSSYHLP
jgi:hypothetical protein